MENKPLTIIDKIKEECKKHGETIASLERKLGFGNGTIRRWEKSPPSIDRVVKICKYFNVTSDYLLGIEKENQTIRALNHDDVSIILSAQTPTGEKMFVGDTRKINQKYTVFVKHEMDRHKLYPIRLINQGKFIFEPVFLEKVVINALNMFLISVQADRFAIIKSMQFSRARLIQT